MTVTPFTPGTGSPPFQFQPTLDGNQYQLTVAWLFEGQRWYMTITDLSGNVIVNQPLIGSPSPPSSADINLVLGYFVTSTLIYRVSTTSFEVTP